MKHKPNLLPNARKLIQNAMQIQTVDIQNIQKGNTYASKMPPLFPPSKVDETMRWSCGGFEFKVDSATHSIFLNFAWGEGGGDTCAL